MSIRLGEICMIEWSLLWHWSGLEIRTSYFTAYWCLCPTIFSTPYFLSVRGSFTIMKEGRIACMSKNRTTKCIGRVVHKSRRRRFFAGYKRLVCRLWWQNESRHQELSARSLSIKIGQTVPEIQAGPCPWTPIQMPNLYINDGQWALKHELFDL